MPTQSVCINGVLSEPISFGYRQGSVLGSLLFIIYINDLPLAVQGYSVEVYADDTLQGSILQACQSVKFKTIMSYAGFTLIF